MANSTDDQVFVATLPQGKRPKSAGLREAYRAAHYSVELEGQPHPLRVGQSSDAVGALLRSLGSEGAAFITAHNPASLQLGPVHNTMADRALRGDLKHAGAHVIKGLGGDPGGKWPLETSYLVTGLSRVDAEELARRYGQYAMLWIEADGAVSLVELFDLDRAARYPLRIPPFSKVELGFNWSGEWAPLRLTSGEWLRILQGEDFSKRSRCGFDGEPFTLDWGFRNGTELHVSYGGDGGTAYDGKLTGVSLTLGERT